MEEKNEFNYYQEVINILKQNHGKLNKKIEQHEENIEKVKTELEQHEENIEKVKTELVHHEENIEKVKTELEHHEENIEKVKTELKELSINMSSIFGLFNSLQNIKNNNDENEILNNLEEVEFNEQFKIEEEIK